MSAVVIPITPGINQSMQCTIPVDSKNITLNFQFRYNQVAGYWFMSVTDKNNMLLLDGVPLLLGNYPSGNILKQYQYLGIGSAYIVPSSNLFTDDPDFSSLGTNANYALVWSDSSTT